MEATWLSIDRGMGKDDMVHIYNEILHSRKKELNNAICSNMDATRDYHIKWNKSEREKQIPYLEFKICHEWTYAENRNRLIDNRSVATNGRGGRGMDWEFGVGRCKLLHL